MEKLTKNEDIFLKKLSDNGFKGTVANRALPSLHGRSLEITLTVPLMQITFERNVGPYSTAIYQVLFEHPVLRISMV